MQKNIYLVIIINIYCLFYFIIKKKTYLSSDLTKKHNKNQYLVE
jgi:hypothetical protein